MNRTGEAAKAFNDVAGSYEKAKVAPLALLELGLMYANQEEYGEAIKAFDRLEQSYPSSEATVHGMYEKGAAYQVMGDLEKAKAQFSAVSEKSKGTIYGDKSLIGLGVVLSARREHSDALQAFADVASRRTDEIGAEAQYRIGESLSKQQKQKEAITALLRVKYIYPSAKDWIARAYLRIGECYEKLAEKGKARETYQMVLKSHKDDVFGKEADKKMRELQ
jgi:TolA-binding protein